MNPEAGTEKVSLTQGYWFYFDDEGMQIAAHGSALSGKETIFIEGEIVSTRRSIKRKSTHTFQYKGGNYQVVFVVESVLTGILSCSLYKNGELISSTTKSYAMKSFSWKTFFTAMAAGVVCGFSVALLIHGLS